MALPAGVWLVLIFALTPAIGIADAQEAADRSIVAGEHATGADQPDRHRLNSEVLAGWGVSGRLVRGKIPIVKITVEQPKVVAAWSEIRNSGLLGEQSADTAELDSRSVTVCKAMALVAMPPILRDLYREDDALDYVPVYVSLAKTQSDAAPELMFSINVNRAMVRRFSALPPGSQPTSEISAEIRPSPWLNAQLRRERR